MKKANLFRCRPSQVLRVVELTFCVSTQKERGLARFRSLKVGTYWAASLDQEIVAAINFEGKTADEVFTITHQAQFKESRDWVNSTANSFSVVATLIVTVAYMASSTVPGGFNNDSGFPIFQNNKDFQMFTLASLVALCFGVAALITFLGIIIRPYNIWDFEINIPLKLIFGFTCSIISIGAMLVSFCAGHSFTVEGQLRSSAFVLYGVLCIPVFFSIMWLSNLYTTLLKTTFFKRPSFR
ncbi:Ankyrin-repeat containing-like protein [Rhynchospora pubera]|uniref:Ankyrin-repeat containing-like protein n=1 Tax=Rhynchospora pubera TaxID=906938 RepID=A0AAV8BSI7_9POAL|nr:Ankyrin-repeat containing-like protein [Rhynchospora pubera]